MVGFGFTCTGLCHLVSLTLSVSCAALISAAGSGIGTVETAPFHFLFPRRGERTPRARRGLSRPPLSQECLSRRQSQTPRKGPAQGRTADKRWGANQSVINDSPRNPARPFLLLLAVALFKQRLLPFPPSSAVTPACSVPGDSVTPGVKGKASSGTVTGARG